MNKVAHALLSSGSVHIEPAIEKYFTWTSGRKSPIYCDNRQLISFPDYRKSIIDSFCKIITQNYPHVELIAGTATAGIPWSAWIADQLNLPMCYIRSKPKGHGLKTAIEGKITTKQNTLIIEDLISTGKSSLEAYKHCKSADLNVLGVLSIFTYNFIETNALFKNHELELKSLCTLENLLEYANETKLLESSDCKSVQEWRDSFDQ